MAKKSNTKSALIQENSKEGVSITRIHLDTKSIEYIDATTDPYAQECIKRVLDAI